MQPPEPVLVLGLLAEERAKLVARLADLAEDQLAAPTVCGAWTVKDIALHLLGSDLSILARLRDGFTDPAAAGVDFSRWDQVVNFLNQIHESWLRATRRLSGQVTCELLRWSGDQVLAYFGSLDPLAIHVPVEWAGPDPAPAWLNIAREYTERWVHHRDILDALGQTDADLAGPRYLGPVLATFVHGLPPALRNVPASPGTRARLVVTGPAGGTWLAVRRDRDWTLAQDYGGPAAATATIDQESAWRLFTRRISPEQALPVARLEGDLALAGQLLRTHSLIQADS